MFRLQRHACQPAPPVVPLMCSGALIIFTRGSLVRVIGYIYFLRPDIIHHFLHTIHNFMNNVDKHLEFKMSTEEHNITNYLDLSINRNTNNIELCIYRKPTYIDITIHFSSKHPRQETGMEQDTYHGRQQWFPYKAITWHEETNNS